MNFLCPEVLHDFFVPRCCLSFFCAERLLDFCVPKGCMIFFGLIGCMIFFGPEMLRDFFLAREVA